MSNDSIISLKLERVKQLATEDNVQVIPELAKLDRQIIGWLTVIFFGLLRFTWALLVLAVVLFILAVWLSVAVQLLFQFLSVFFPERESVALILMAIASGWVIYRAEGWRTLLDDEDVWVQTEIEERPLRFLLSAYARLVQLIMAGYVTGFLLFSLLPFAVIALAALEQTQPVFANWSDTVAFLQLFWLPSLGSFLLILGFFLILRGRSRESLIKANLYVVGGLGLALIVFILMAHTDSFWTNLRTQWPYYTLTIIPENPAWKDVIVTVYAGTATMLWDVIVDLVGRGQSNIIGIFLLLIFAYPFGFALYIARFFHFPYKSFYKATFWTAPRLRLRWHISKTLRYHRKRNYRQVAGDAWATVCQEHLLRFVSSKTRRSYMRRLKYYHCPTCKRDNNVYTGVTCIAMKLDITMQQQEQSGSTLYLHGLDWMHHHDQRPLPAFDVLLIGETLDHQIDEFCAIYMNKQLGPYHKPLPQIVGQVLSGTQLHINEKNLLQAHLKQVRLDFPPKSAATPCSQSARLQDSFRRQKRRVRRTAVRTARFVVVLFGLLLLYLGWIYLF